MTTLKLMLQGVTMATLMLGSVAFAQATEPPKPDEPVIEPTQPTKNTDQPNATEPIAPAEPAEPAAPAEPQNMADEPVAKQQTTDDEMAKAEEELTRVQATKTHKDKWDKCEEESHYAKGRDPNNPTQAEQDAYKTQMACMGQVAE